MLTLSKDIEELVSKRLSEWESGNVLERMWERDQKAWS